eukprot:6230393-Amphidinium_carterae.1
MELVREDPAERERLVRLRGADGLYDRRRGEHASTTTQAAAPAPDTSNRDHCKKLYDEMAKLAADCGEQPLPFEGYYNELAKNWEEDDIISDAAIYRHRSMAGQSTAAAAATSSNTATPATPAQGENAASPPPTP